MNSSFEEVEKIGIVALISLMLVPGIIWISKAKGGGGMALRSAIVGSLLVGITVLEATMDDTANSIVESV